MAEEKEVAQEVDGKVLYNEIPSLKFSKVGSLDVFDVDYFLETVIAANPKLSGTVEEYLASNDKYVTMVMENLKISKKQAVLKLEGESTKMVSALAFDFASWVDPYMKAWIFNRTHEILTDGFSVSDLYLNSAANARLTPAPKEGE